MGRVIATVTSHGDKRVRKRIGVNRSGVGSVAERAWQLGLDETTTSGKLKKYIFKIIAKNEYRLRIKIYGENVYIYDNLKLVTTYNLPTKLKKIAKQQKERNDTRKIQISERENTPN